MSAIAPLSHVLLQSLTKVDYPDRIMAIAFEKQFCVRREIDLRSAGGGISHARITINRFNSVSGYLYNVQNPSSDASSPFLMTDVNKNRFDRINTAEEAVKHMVQDIAYLYDDSEVDIV